MHARLTRWGAWLGAILLAVGVVLAAGVFLGRNLALMVLAEGVGADRFDVAATGRTGSLLLDGSEDAQFVTRDGRSLPARGHGTPVETAHMLDDGRTAITIDRDGTIRRTDTQALGLLPADPDGGFLARVQASLWQDFGRPLGRFSLDVMLDQGEQVTLRDCDECPEMVVVPAGSFVMGSPAGEEGRYDDEGPQHTVTIAQAFAVGKFEVTRGQYASFVQATGRGNGDGCRSLSRSEFIKLDPNRNWRNPGFLQTDKHPVICVNRDDAQAYVQWLASRTGKRYRLLSEAEREYVARAGTTGPFVWGKDPNSGCGIANAADKSAQRQMPSDWTYSTCDDRSVFTAAVGRYAANRFGLHDIIGNALEWTEDCWDDSYAGAPTDGSARRTGDCSRRVLRGGAWSGNPRDLRSAVRSGSSPSLRDFNVGFRVARTL